MLSIRQVASGQQGYGTLRQVQVLVDVEADEEQRTDEEQRVSTRDYILQHEQH